MYYSWTVNGGWFQTYTVSVSDLINWPDMEGVFDIINIQFKSYEYFILYNLLKVVDENCKISTLLFIKCSLTLVLYKFHKTINSTLKKKHLKNLQIWNKKLRWKSESGKLVDSGGIWLPYACQQQIPKTDANHEEIILFVRKRV